MNERHVTEVEVKMERSTVRASNVTNLAMSSIVPRVEPGRIFTADGHKLGTPQVGFITACCAFLTLSGPLRKRAVSRAFSNNSFLIG